MGGNIMYDEDRLKLQAINSIIKPRKPFARRGRFPRLLLKSLEILAPCRGYANGITINNFTKRLYGEDTFINRTKGRQMISQIRKHWEIYIYSTKPMGVPNAERRYCHLQEPDEFQQVINEFKEKRDGFEQGRKRLVSGKRKEVKVKQLEKVMVRA